MAYTLLYYYGMNAGIYSLSTAMRSGYEDRLGVITDNLANSATPGYRRTHVSQAAFDAIFDQALRTEFGQSIVTEPEPSVLATDFTQGSLKNTGRPLDFAINGDGFFVVARDNREYYTRNGEFQAATDGQLITTGGLVVQGEAGPIAIPSGVSPSTLTVDPNGTLYAEEQTLGRIRMVEFLDSSNLIRVGPTLFDASPGISPIEAENSELSNKMLEGSNSSVFEEMAELIVCMRSFEACQRMIRMDDEAQRKMIDQMKI